MTTDDENFIGFPALSNKEIKSRLERAKAGIEMAIRAVDARPAERPREPFDGKPILRPHTIKGWWQVWSGGICMHLLSDEDVRPIKEAK